MSDSTLFTLSYQQLSQNGSTTDIDFVQRNPPTPEAHLLSLTSVLGVFSEGHIPHIATVAYMWYLLRIAPIRYGILLPYLAPISK